MEIGIVYLEVVGIAVGLALAIIGLFMAVLSHNAKRFATGWTTAILGFVIMVISVLVIMARTFTMHIGVG